MSFITDLFGTILTDTITMDVFIKMTGVAIVLGIIIAISFSYMNKISVSFSTTLALLPVMVEVVILLVNGNLGTGVAVMGAFSLVRFRSIPGSAKEIGSVFLAMSVGLACGTGYVGIAIVLTILCCVLNYIYTSVGNLMLGSDEKELKITIPESLDYTGVFDDIFANYTKKVELCKVKTSNMGSLYQLFYRIKLRNNVSEKNMIDEIRCRNGNLDIICGKVPTNEKGEL